jgi:uncharacterized protein
MSLTKEDKQALEEFKGKIFYQLKDYVLDLKLFGSKAQDTDSPDSDLDVLVLVHRSDPDLEDKIIDIAFEVNLQHDIYLSPRVIEAAKMNDPLFRITPFYKNLERDGIRL